MYDGVIVGNGGARSHTRLLSAGGGVYITIGAGIQVSGRGSWCSSWSGRDIPPIVSAALRTRVDRLISAGGFFRAIRTPRLI